MGWSDIWNYVKKGTEFKDLVKTGVAALSTYASWKDQEKKNQMQQGVYDDFMAQAADAGHEAQAAVDINLTPMTVSGVPTTKADITDFTPVAKGGLMTLPNKQRKRYAYGPGQDEVMETQEEVLSPFDLQQETGLDLMGEQVKYETGNPREGAWSVWNSGGINQEIYDFDFEIFFDSGDWSDHLRGQVDVEENMQMASAPAVDDELNDMYQDYKLQQIEIDPSKVLSFDEWRSSIESPLKGGGIAGLRHGGRARYADSDWIVKKSDVEEEQVPRMGRAGQAAPEKLDWFQDLYLDREGGGGKDFIVPEKYKNLLDDDDERFDEWNRLESKKETFEGGAGKNLMKKAIRIMDKAYDLDEELHKKINNEFLEIVNSGDSEPGEAYYYIIKKYGDILEMKKGGIAGLRYGGRPGYQEGIGPNQGSPSIMANATTDMEVEDASGIPVSLEAEIKEIAAGSGSGEDFPATDSDFLALEILSDKHKIDLEVVIQIAKETNFTTPEQSKGELYAQYMAKGGRPGYADSNAEEFQITQSVEPPEGYYDISARDKLNPNEMLSEREDFWNEKFTPERGEHVQKFDKPRQEVYELAEAIMGGPEKISFTEAIKKAEEILLADSDWIIKEGKQKRIKYPFFHEQEEPGTNRYDYLDEKAKGGRIRKAPGGIMNLGGLEKDYRTTGGFVPLGGRERADDVPARLSKNEFVMTADAVRAAGGGSINKGAQRMYDTMKHLEASPQSNRMIS